MGRFFSARSCFGFLSFAAAGFAESEGTSIPIENMHAKERMTDRNDLGDAEIEGRCWPGPCCTLLTLSYRAESSRNTGRSIDKPSERLEVASREGRCRIFTLAGRTGLLLARSSPWAC